MGRGSYLGGSTIIGPLRKRKKKRKASGVEKSPSLPPKTPQEKEAELQERIRIAAERLAKAQAEFDAGIMKPSKKARKSTGPKLSQRIKRH